MPQHSCRHQPINTRHVDVHKNQVKFLARALAYGERSAGNLTDGVPFGLQYQPNQIAVCRHVVCYQYLFVAHRWRRNPGGSQRRLWRCYLLNGQLNGKNSAIAFLGLHAEFAPHFADELLTDKKAQPGTLTLICRRGV